jgi:hypothetical protein
MRWTAVCARGLPSSVDVRPRGAATWATAGGRAPVIGEDTPALERCCGRVGRGAPEVAAAPGRRTPEQTKTAAPASAAALNAIDPNRPSSRHWAGSPTYGTRNRASPCTSAADTCVLSLLWLASPRVTSEPSAAKETRRCSSSRPGCSGSVNSSTCPARRSEVATGSVSTTSPTSICGAIEPLTTTCADRPTACGAREAITSPARTASRRAAATRAAPEASDSVAATPPGRRHW